MIFFIGWRITEWFFLEIDLQLRAQAVGGFTGISAISRAVHVAQLQLHIVADEVVVGKDKDGPVSKKAETSGAGNKSGAAKGKAGAHAAAARGKKKGQSAQQPPRADLLPPGTRVSITGEQTYTKSGNPRRNEFANLYGFDGAGGKRPLS